MDLSTLTEAQQQQLQQLHQQFQQHQLQQQQQQKQQEYTAHAYDPSQVQAYDQASQAYYSYHNYPQQQQQYYPYYQPDYANSAYQQQDQPQSQPLQHDQAAVQPPGVSIASDASQILAAAAPQGQGQGQWQGQPQGEAQVPEQQHQPNGYYPQSGGEQQNAMYPVPPGLNPAAAAAVAALSQLTQFAGTMEAAERAMTGLHERQWPDKSGGYGPMPGQGPPFHHRHVLIRSPVGRSPYRGGGRSGGGPFRGGGRGNFGHRNPRDGSGPSFRGRGRMARGGGRRFPPHASASTSPHPAPTPAQEPVISAEGETAPINVVQGQAPQASVSQQSTPVPGQAPTRRAPQIAWCELCRVDCNSLEILEQHKTGKKHKKNLQKFEELQNANNSVAEKYIDQKPMPELKPEGTVQPENAQEGDENQPLTLETLPTEVATDENKMEVEQQNDAMEKSEIVKAELTEAPARRPRMDHFDGWRRGMKRKMRGGRGGKRLRTSEMPRRPVEPPKPKEVVTLICDLCNVKCDTQAVFDCHLAGRKHISKLKRFHGHQAMYGPMGLQALYPPNANVQSMGLQSLYTPNPNAQSTSLISQPHQPVIYGPQGYLPQPAAYGRRSQNVVPAGFESQSHKVLQLNESQVSQGSLPQPASYVPQSQHVVAVGLELQAQKDSEPQDSQVPQGSLPQPAAYVPQFEHAVAISLEPQAQNDSQLQKSQVSLVPGSQETVLVELTVQEQAPAIGPEGIHHATVETKSENERKEMAPLNNSVAAPQENAIMGAGQVFPVTDGSVSVPKHGVTSAEYVVLPGLDTKMDEPGSANEVPTD